MECKVGGIGGKEEGKVGERVGNKDKVSEIQKVW